jgi:hypothetical protein
MYMHFHFFFILHKPVLTDVDDNLFILTKVVDELIDRTESETVSIFPHINSI